jgi:hypothetical protein
MDAMSRVRLSDRLARTAFDQIRYDHLAAIRRRQRREAAARGRAPGPRARFTALLAHLLATITRRATPTTSVATATGASRTYAGAVDGPRPSEPASVRTSPC